MERRRIGEILVEAGVITSHELKVALEAQRHAPAPLGKTLVALGMAREEEILPYLAQQLNRVDVFSLDPARDQDTVPTVTEAVQRLLTQAFEMQATDIHLEPMGTNVTVRVRIDGILREIEPSAVVKAQYPAVVSRIKVMGNLDIAEKRMPQEGRMTIRWKEEDLDLRVSILPSRYGESVVIRILHTQVPLGLSKLGMDPKSLEILHQMLARRYGMILVTGPTGSGKTTTLYACLHFLNSPTRKIVTIEDPIEYSLPGAIQMQVMPQIDLTFGRLLKTVLRHDPNIIMVGEIRDLETAEVAIRTALTGHLVLSTMHTNDAASTITRLLEMGVEPYLISSSLTCSIAQRLVRTICQKCGGKRCVSCLGTGLRGRTGIFEILPVDDEIRALALKQASLEEIRQCARRKGMRTLREDGLEKVRAGITTQEELDRVIHQDELL